MLQLLSDCIQKGDAMLQLAFDCVRNGDAVLQLLSECVRNGDAMLQLVFAGKRKAEPAEFLKGNLESCPDERRNLTFLQHRLQKPERAPPYTLAQHEALLEVFRREQCAPAAFVKGVHNIKAFIS